MLQSKNSLAILVFVFMVSVLFWTGSVKASSESDSKSVADSINAFSLDLYEKLKQPGKNLFMSPYSGSVALSMAYAGSRGETESQMAKVLHYNTGQDQVHEALSALQRAIKSSASSSGISLNIANALWGQKGYDFREQFLDVLKSQYGSRFREVDFKGSPGEAITEINRWGNEETKGRIKDLLGKLPPDTRLILANAIYFKGMWDSKFKKSRTKKEIFFLNGGSEIQVPLMRRTDDFGYMEEKNFQALELPYKGNRFSMFVFLPRRKSGLAQFEKSLTMKSLADYLKSRRVQKVKVYLPRFKLTDSLELRTALASLGMNDAFSFAKADFSWMSADEVRDLFIGSVRQKSFVEVKEEGTEAVAVTTIEMRPQSIVIQKEPPPIPVFRADHPFMFFIRHNPTNCILFMGRVVKPDQL